MEAAKRFGYDNLNDLQLQAVVGLVSGHDVFGILPTGYGQSLCYGCCLLWTFDRIGDVSEPSIVCVVTQLTAIIEDQESLEFLLHADQAKNLVFCLQPINFIIKASLTGTSYNCTI